MAKVTTTQATRELIARTVQDGRALLPVVEGFAESLAASLRAFDAEVKPLGLSDAKYRAAGRSCGLDDAMDFAIDMHAALEAAMSQADL